MKRFSFLVSLLATCFFSPAQSFPTVALKAILADAPNDFGSFRGGLNTIAEDDSFYFSTVVMEGSKNNEISQLSGRLTQYHAYIADSATKKKQRRW